MEAIIQQQLYDQSESISPHKVAVLIEINNYSQLGNQYENLPSQLDNIKLLDKALSDYSFKTNIIVQCSIQSDIPFHTRLDTTMKQIQARVESASDFNQYMFAFVYYRGQGVTSTDQSELYGVLPNGFQFSWNAYALKFSQCKNVISLFYLDCPRVKGNMLKAKSLPNGNVTQVGTSYIFYGCEPDQNLQALLSSQFNLKAFNSLLKSDLSRNFSEFCRNLPRLETVGQKYDVTTQNWRIFEVVQENIIQPRKELIDQEVQTTNEELNEAKQTIQELEVIIMEVQEQWSNEVKEKKILEKIIEQRDQKISDQEKEALKYQRQISDLENEALKYQRQISDQTKSLSKLQDEIINQEQKLMEVNKNLEIEKLSKNDIVNQLLSCQTLLQEFSIDQSVAFTRQQSLQNNDDVKNPQIPLNKVKSVEEEKKEPAQEPPKNVPLQRSNLSTPMHQIEMKKSVIEEEERSAFDDGEEETKQQTYVQKKEEDNSYQKSLTCQGKQSSSQLRASVSFFDMISDDTKIENSEIISEKQLKNIKKWLNKECSFTKIFENKNLRSHQRFHDKCDDKGPLLFLIRSCQGVSFGAYISVKLNKYSQFIADPNAFIFSLSENSKHVQYRFQDKAIGYFDDKYLVCGGSGDPNSMSSDLYICDLDSDQNMNYCNLGYTYQLPENLKYSTEKSKSYLAGSFKFNVTKFEVYQVR